MSALATLADLKTRLDITATDRDDLLTAILAEASAIAAREAGVPTLLRATSVTLYPFTPGVPDHGVASLRLDRGPVELISEVKVRYHISTTWPNAEDWTEDEEFVINPEPAVLTAINRTWPAHRRRQIRVTGTFGYQPPEESPVSGAFAPPDDLQHGVLQQAIQMYQTRASAGIESFDFGDGGSVSFRGQKPHPALVAAVRRLPFVRLL